VVNVRANLLEAESVFRAAALDEYAFLRDAYLQRRRNLIYDGNAVYGGPKEGRPHRKTLKELEEELDLEEPAAPAPTAPEKQ
jgi:phospholipid-binding lipoprotein MlaA